MISTKIKRWDMGGSGSGSWYRWDSKSTTESQHRIDIRWLKKQRYLRPDTMGTLSWSWRDKQTGSIGFRMEADRMVLNYRHRPHGGDWEDVEQAISFYRTPCNYGGFRTWFLCPRCWQRKGSGSLWRREILSLPSLLWFNLCQPAGKQSRPAYEKGKEDQRTVRFGW